MNKDYYTEEEMEYICADIFDSKQDIYAEIEKPTYKIYIFINTISDEDYHFDLSLNAENLKDLTRLIYNLRRQRVNEKRIYQQGDNQLEK